MKVPHRYTSPADRAMYKAMIVNMPIFLLMYIFSYLDRVNVAFAKQVLQNDIGLSNQAFALGAGIFFIGYVAFDVPSNIAMYYIGARRWLARIMITWGLVSASFAFVTTDTMFYFLRFLLGVAEAGLFPAVVYFLTLWFSVRWRGTILGLFYMGMPLSMVIGGPISGFLLDMDGLLGGFHGWQLMFLIEGILTIMIGLCGLSFLVDKPQDANWMTQEEKDALAAELQVENIGKHARYINPWMVIFDSRVWYLSFIYFPIVVTVNGITFYLPTQIAELLGRQVGTMVGFVSGIPYFCAIIALCCVSKYSDKTGNRASLGAMLMGCSGIAVLLSNTSQPVYGIVALCIAITCSICAVPIFWTLPSRILIGITAASGIGFINSLSHIGGFFGPNIRVWAEQYFNDPHAGLTAIGCVALFGSILFVIANMKKMGNDKTFLYKH